MINNFTWIYPDYDVKIIADKRLVDATDLVSYVVAMSTTNADKCC